MSRIHATLADRRPEGEIERIVCGSTVRLQIMFRGATAALNALSAPVPAPSGKSKQRKLRSSLNPAWRDLSSEPANF